MVESIRELRRICQPRPKSREFFYTKMMRKISIYFTKVFLSVGISANQATLIQILFMVSSLLVLVLYPNWFYLVLSAVLLNVSFLFDHVDGEIARYRGPTYFGRMLDLISHDLYYSVFVFIGWGAFLHHGHLPLLLFGICASFFTILFRLHMMRFEFINLETKIKCKNSRFRYFYDITLANFFLPVLYLMALADMLDYFIYFYGIYIPLFWLTWLIRKRKLFMSNDAGKSDEKIFWDEMRVGL